GGDDPVVHGARCALGGVETARAACALDRAGPAAGGGYRARLAAVWPSVSHLAFPVRRAALARAPAAGVGGAVRPRRVQRGGRRHRADADSAGAPVAAASAPA